MIHPSTKVFGSFGYGPVSLLLQRAVPVAWTGHVYYIFSEHSSQPLIVTDTTEFLTRSPKGHPIWTRARDLRPSMYIGTPMSDIKSVAEQDSTDTYRRQAWSILIGHPRSVRKDALDDESARGDIVCDPKRVWFKVHDIETSIEPPVLMYRVVDRPVLAQNVLVREYDAKRNRYPD